MAESFGRNLSGWCELVDYFHTAAPTICVRCKYWTDDSLHDGLDAAGAVALADALQTELDAGRTAVYAAFELGPDYDIFEEKPSDPHYFVANVASFIAFLRKSGGFEIW